MNQRNCLSVVASLWIVHPAASFAAFPRTTFSTAIVRLAHSPWQSHVSTHPESSSALTKIFDEITGDISEIDVAFLFIGQAHASTFESLVHQASERFGPDVSLVSLIGGGVIGENVELDEPTRPSMSIMTGTLPKGAQVDIFQYHHERDKALELDVDSGSFLLFADPFSPVETLTAELSKTASVIAGGISCPLSARPSIAIGNQQLPIGTVVGLGFSGTLGLQTIVAQGCRPIGPTFRITACDDNVITKLDGKPALEVLQKIADISSPLEQNQISSGLMCGISASEDCQDDYLGRQIMGFVPSVSGISVGSQNINVGDRFCFQVRDEKTAEQDLELMVERTKTARMFDEEHLRGKPVAALQISCVGRGRNMFGVPNVDLSNVKKLVDGPVAGFYANGEIGPVGLAGFSTTANSQPYLHGFTTVAAILCEYIVEDEDDKSMARTDSPGAWG